MKNVVGRKGTVAREGKTTPTHSQRDQKVGGNNESGHCFFNFVTSGLCGWTFKKVEKLVGKENCRRVWDRSTVCRRTGITGIPGLQHMFNHHIHTLSLTIWWQHPKKSTEKKKREKVRQNNTAYIGSRRMKSSSTEGRHLWLESFTRFFCPHWCDKWSFGCKRLPW